jgi:nicotinamidase-related amidase
MSDAPTPYFRSRDLLSRGDSKLLIVDVQEKFMPTIPVADQLIRNCRKLLEGAKIVGVPAFATEQYPKGLGPTVPQLAELLGDRPAKLRFSCGECLGWPAASEDERYKVIVAGIETHVCIQQTALDLLSAGFQVYVPADAVASRHKPDWKFALERLRDSGATITTTESVLFEWAEVAGTEEFRQIARLVK